MPAIAYYYDLTDDLALTSDPEGTLVMLCASCADDHAGEVEWAGDEAPGCELCDALDLNQVLLQEYE